MSSKIYILTGDKQSGKTTALWDFVKHKSDVKGFVTMDHEDGHRYFIDLSNNVTIPYASKIYDENAISIGNWYIQKEALKYGVDIISNYDINSNEPLVIDEIGSLELNGQGYYETLILLLKRLKDKECTVNLIIVVRVSLVEEVVTFFDLREAIVIIKEELPCISLESKNQF